MELQIIHEKIFILRGSRVILDYDLAVLYETENRLLKRSVRRNQDRFPDDFMFQITKKEWQEVVPNWDNLPERFSPVTPFAFTEQGVAMLSSVLHSKKAIAVNIAIMRAFVLLLQHLTDYKELKDQIERLEREMNMKFEDINQALNYLLSPKYERRPIGFKNQKNTD